MTVSPKRIALLLGLALALALVLTGCAAQATETPEVEVVPTQTCPSCPECPTPTEPAPCPEAKEAPFEAEFMASPHAKADAEAFVHWDEEGSVPATCANCHTSQGYQDFLGADGSAVGTVDAEIAAPAGTLECATCHNSASVTLTSVTFPSGITIDNLGDASRCMVCHQGRESKVSVDKQITDFAAEDPDAVPEPITDASGNTRRFGFRNVHYYAAAATLYGTEVKGGYEYDGMLYDAKNEHVEGYASCIDCHNPHTLEVKVEQCAFCHEGVTSVEDLKEVRMVSSAQDYDGDGDIEEGMYHEIAGLQEMLYTMLQTYASETIGTGFIYDSAAYPYFFADGDGDGAADQGENGAVSFSDWTPRFLKAAYNYQVSLKDPGNYAHGNKYVVQLLYDSINDLNAGLASPVDTSALHRDDAGHFAGNTEAFRHWDADGEVPGSCARCHSASGVPTFVKNGVNIAADLSNGFLCSTCHDESNWPARYEVASVTFPSGKVISFAQDADGKNIAAEANICLLCHQGRSSKRSVDTALGDKELDTPDPSIRFANIHYFAAGATIFGTEVQGAYEYAGKTYLGQNPHPGNESIAVCTACHDVHSLEVDPAFCQNCHGTTDLAAIRAPGDTVDYDGDGDTAEGMKGEIDTLAETLYAQILTYASTTSTGIVYDSHRHPYFFLDADGDGTPDVGDNGNPTGYNAFTPRLLKAAYNYQYVLKDPGAFTHNPKYVIQFLIDSIEDLGGDISTYTRP